MMELIFLITDLPADSYPIDDPTLIIHGSDDQIVAIVDSALISAKVVRGWVLKVYYGAPNGLFATNKAELSGDLLAFGEGS